MQNFNLKSCLQVIIFGIFILCFQQAQARHIIGGEITYECLGVDTINGTVTFEFTMKIYRDCYGGGAGFDPDPRIGVYYRAPSGQWTHIPMPSGQYLNATGPMIRRLDPSSDNPCVIIPPNVCVEEGTYTFTRTLPIITSNYMFVYQRCCRNNTIANINAPWDAGAAYTVEITPEAQISCNNSPVFNSFPPIVICADEPLDFDHGATDAEGDQLVYEFCAPIDAGGTRGTQMNPGMATACDGVTPDPINCTPPYPSVQFKLPAYSPLNPMGGSPQVRINPTSGRITGTPVDQGQFVVGVCVKEYRQGRLIGTLRRDFQFNVAYCEPTVVAELDADEVVNGREFIINSCGNNTVEFLNNSYNASFIKEYLWEFDINNQTQTFNTRDVTVTFPGIGQYSGTMVINPGTECSDTAEINVNVFPEIEADFEFAYDTCIAGPVSFTDMSQSGAGPIANWRWQFGDGDFSRSENPFHLYADPGEKRVLLNVIDGNRCEDTISKNITWYPVPPLIIVEPSTFVGCNPAEITFVNLSTPIDETYDIVWNFGDGSEGYDISPTHIFENPGTYSVSVEITSPIGCYTEARFENLITVQPSPIAQFDYNPKELNSFNKTVDFFDQSIGANAWQWNFDNEAVAFDPNTSYSFRDTGRHRIELVVIHPSGCPDTAVAYIDIRPVVTYFLPNAFTPNGDGKNEVYLGKGVYDGMRDFQMHIWNRWGEKVFESTDPLEGWDGRKATDGAIAPNGVYVVRVSYIGPRGEMEEIKGFATLIR